MLYLAQKVESFPITRILEKQGKDSESREQSQAAPSLELCRDQAIFDAKQSKIVKVESRAKAPIEPKGMPRQFHT